MDLIVARKLSKSFGKQRVLHQLDFELKENQNVAILGSSGSGKSTLLHLIAALDQPDQGTLLVDGDDLGGYDEDQRSLYRNKKIGLVFQFHFLLPSFSALENILLPSSIAGFSKKMRKELEEEVLHLAESIGVQQCLSKYPGELSGGEQQRINLLRALSLRPKLILCDEPTGNLDRENSELVGELLLKIVREQHSTLIVVTHDRQLAEKFSLKYELNEGSLQVKK